ncbi:transposase [Chryseolinea soli]|uniref:transposase n=1 Tax=Chryseolinea soli TaxID=2321403 RepID=UPI00202B990F|nr:transposase [Chryseolinea soli]
MLHLVWCTKDRLPLLTAKVKPAILNHIRQNAKIKGIFIDTMEGHLDHIHAFNSIECRDERCQSHAAYQGRVLFLDKPRTTIHSRF